MGKAMDFEKLRKKRQRKTTARRLFALLAVAGAIVGAVLVNNYLIDVGLTTRIRDVVESYGGGGFPISAPGGILRDIKTLDGDLAVLNDTNLYVYNAKGKIISSFQKMQDTTVLICSGKRALTYNIGGKRLTVHSRGREMFAKELEHNILSASMNDSGDIAAVTSSRQYVAQITAFDRKGEESFRWYSADNLIANVAIAPSGERMAAVCVNTQGGQLKTVLYLFDFGREDELQKQELLGELVLNVAYLPDGRFSLLTDKQYAVYSADGIQEAAYRFEGREVIALERQGSDVLLLMRSVQSGYNRTQQVLLLDRKCTELAALSVGGKVRDMALGTKEVYLLTSDGVRAYTRELTLKNEFLHPGISNIHLAGNKLYSFTQDEISLLAMA